MNTASEVRMTELSGLPLWVCGAAFKLRAILMVPLLIYAFVHYDLRFEESPAEWIVGLVAFSAGFVIRLVSQRHLFYRLTGDRALATTGPYRIIRNPVYIGNMLILGGLALMAEVPQMALVLVIWAAIVYSLSVRFEESRLQKRFGLEYDAYAARTPRWIPHSGLPTVESPGRISTWMQAFGAEWHCFLLILFPLAKEILERRLLYGTP